MTKRQRKLVELWNEIEEAEPDISTERLFAMTVSRANDAGYAVDDGDVANALHASSSPAPGADRGGRR